MKKVFLLIGFVLLGTYAFAQEVSLVTSGEGTTKDAATASALRSAIEQSFGVFVSANTTILNDDIVRDEVATVASGNIKSYKELSCVQNANGVYMVSVEAVVSIGKLISYAKAHGSSAEFAGQTFAMEIKMRELNKKNEYEALQNLLIQLQLLKDNILEGEVTVKDPVSINTGYRVPVELTIKTNQNYLSFYDILYNTLSSLSLTPTEEEAYVNSKTNCTRICKQVDYKDYYGIVKVYVPSWDKVAEEDRICLRNDEQVIKKFLSDVCNILNNAHRNIKIREKGGKGQIKGTDEKIAVALQPNFRGMHGLPPNNLLFGWTSSYGEFYFGYKMESYEGSSFSETVIVTLPQESDFVFAKHLVNFDYTIEELSNVLGFEVSTSNSSK